MTKKLIAIIALTITTISTQAQNVTYGNLNTWFLLLNRFTLSEKWSITNELHERTGSFLSEQGQFLERPSIDYHLNKNIEFSLGYTFIRVSSYEPYTLPISRNEHNIWEQMLMKFDVGNVHFQNRFRLEHRWVQRIVNNANNETVIDGSQYSNRFRYRFTATFDVVKFDNDAALFVNLFDELWINQWDNYMPRSFARNWLYGGLGYRFNPSTNLQLGYMNQYDDAGNNNYISSGILQMTFVKNFDFVKKHKEPVYRLETSEE